MSDRIKKENRTVSAISRRKFLNYAASSAAAFTIVPRYILGGKTYIAPSDRLNIAIIGAGGQGFNNMKDLLRYPDIQIASICDVNEESDYSQTYYGGTAGRFSALAVLKNHYESQPDFEGRKLCPDYVDFRDILDKEKAIDACKGGSPASANFDFGGPLTELVLLGVVAMRTQKKLYWDGPSMKATNAPEADEYIRPEYHNGWKLG